MLTMNIAVKTVRAEGVTATIVYRIVKDIVTNTAKQMVCMSLRQIRESVDIKTRHILSHNSINEIQSKIV